MNISLPPEMMEEVKKRAKAGKYSTLSEYVRHLIRLENTERMAREIDEERAKIKSGKLKLLTKLDE